MGMSHKRDFLSHEVTPAAGWLGALVHDYLEDLEIRGKSQLTAKHYGANLATFLEWLAFQSRKERTDLTTVDVDNERLRTYLLFLARRRDPRSGRPIGPAARNVYVTALREFLRYVRRRGHEVPDPTEALPRARERDVEIRHLGREEFERLRAAIDLKRQAGLRDRTIVETLFGSAVRVSELASLTVRGTDLKRREIQIVGKGAKSRLVLLTEEAASWIHRYLATRRDECASLFVTSKARTVRGLGVRQVQRVVETAAMRAGLPVKVSPHWLRHSRLTILARHSGVEVAQRVAGHSSLATTARYLHVTDTQLRALYDQAEKADRDAGGG